VPGVGDVFLLYCEAGSAASTLVTVSPASVTLNQGIQQQFAAVVQNNANHSVNWGVDGIAGGNVTVGTIDSTGLYTAPDAAGAHTVTATSVADPTASGSAAVNVTSTGDGSGGGWLVNGV
jgi:trimeric autotransporter adhesin